MLKIPLPLLIIIFVSILSFPVQGEAERVHLYEVDIDDRLEIANVKICFDGKAPEYLSVNSRKATKNIIQLPETQSGYIEYLGRVWKTKKLNNNACLNYKVDISEHTLKPRSFLNVRPVKKTKPLSCQTENTWLWLPEKLADNEFVDINFQLNSAFNISTPWSSQDPKGRSFRLGKTPHDWGFTLMMGDFKLQEIPVGEGKNINLAILNQVKQQDNLTQWVSDVSQVVTDYLGEFPLDDVQIIMMESKRPSKGPVPWGEVTRGSGVGIRLVVNSTKEIDDFYADWTATHELGHLLIPKVKYKDSWLSEGLASYLQYVFMARSGQLKVEEAWSRLFNGMKRGEKGTKSAPKEQLIEAAENRKRGARWDRTKRIYWSGAVYFLNADYQLRRQSKGQQGLSDVLKKFSYCCIKSVKKWDGMELALKFNELSKTNIFTTLYKDMAYSKKFPEYQSIFADLGVTVVKNEVTFYETKNSDIRNQIVGLSKALNSNLKLQLLNDNN